MKNLMLGCALALVSAGPALAQDATATTGTMTASDIGMAPLTGVSATDYVKMAADSDMYEIKSSKLALSRSKRDDVKGFARDMIADHMQTTKALMAALKNPDRNIAKPGMKMSAENESNIALLKKAPKDQFDTLYLQQQTQAHQKAWALHKGYATDGTDAALKQVAASAVPVVERHIGHAKGIQPAGMTGTSPSM